jgi:hypothetical protein
VLYTEDDVRAAIKAALENVVQYDDDDRDELEGNVEAGLQYARGAVIERLDVDMDVLSADADDVMVARRNLAREDKLSKAREKARNKLKTALDARILMLAESAKIVPPFRVRDGGTISLGTRVWARPDVPPIPDGTPDDEAERIKAEARARFVATLKGEEDTAVFVKEDANIQSVSSYFKEEIEHGRVKLDNDGKARIGGIVISEGTTVSVRGA